MTVLSNVDVGLLQSIDRFLVESKRVISIQLFVVEIFVHFSDRSMTTQKDQLLLGMLDYEKNVSVCLQQLIC